MKRITIKARVSIPVQPGERFNVKNGDGNVVETWEHHHSKDGYHHYDVIGYEDNR